MIVDSLVKQLNQSQEKAAIVNMAAIGMLMFELVPNRLDPVRIRAP